MRDPTPRAGRASGRPRRPGGDDLGLRRALGDRMLPLLVGAMVFLAALAAAGVVGARALAWHWRAGAGAVLTVQVPRPDESVMPGGPPRWQRALDLLRAEPVVASARTLAPAEIDALLAPWFGGPPPPGLALPGVIDVRLVATADPAAAEPLAAGLAAAVPDTLLDSDTAWSARLGTLAASLQACAWLALAIVAVVAALIVAAATRGGLVARREAIAIAHGLGATDAYVAARFARRATGLALAGALAGALAALPVLLALASLAAPLVAAEAPPDAEPWWQRVPAELWLGLLALPWAAAAIGFVTAQATVRSWLRHLP